MDQFHVTPLRAGRPDHPVSDKVAACYDLLEQLNIPYELVEYPRPPQGQEELVMVDEALGVPGIKNLMFNTKNKKNFFFVILPRDQSFDSKAFREKFGFPKLEMSKEAALLELLNTTIGSVSVMELAHDTEHQVQLFVEESVLSGPYFRFHPNENSATVRIPTESLKDKLLPALGHELNLL